MKKQIIHLFGAAGSGTSTLGKYIADKLGYFLMDTDDYFWERTNPPFTTKRKPMERLDMMRADIFAHKNVVISGSLTEWGDELMPLFTLAIRVKTDTATRLERIDIREHERFGNRIDPGGDMFGQHCEFVNWASNYDRGDLDMRSKMSHDLWQKKLECPLVIVDGALPLEDNFERLKVYLVKES